MYNVHTRKFMKQECRKGEADAAMKQDYQIFLIFLLQRMLHASCLLHCFMGVHTQLAFASASASQM